MGKDHKLIDLTGKKFSRLTVLERAPKQENRPHAYWKCVCDCGVTKIIQGNAIRFGLTTSCGCYNREQNVKRLARDYPDPKTLKPEYLLWSAAKFRAKRDKVPFDIDYTDIIIPTHCPVLGIKLKKGIGKPTDNSASLDKIIPSKGYVRDNIRVISFRANSIKRDATVEELQKVLKYVEAAMFHQ
jgi:hypothetical protein